MTAPASGWAHYPLTPLDLYLQATPAGGYAWRVYHEALLLGHGWASSMVSAKARAWQAYRRASDLPCWSRTSSAYHSSATMRPPDMRAEVESDTTGCARWVLLVDERPVAAGQVTQPDREAAHRAAQAAAEHAWRAQLPSRPLLNRDHEDT